MSLTVILRIMVFKMENARLHRVAIVVRCGNKGIMKGDISITEYLLFKMPVAPCFVWWGFWYLVHQSLYGMKSDWEARQLVVVLA